MAGGRWRGRSGGARSGPPRDRDYDLDDAEFTDLMAAGLGMTSGIRPQTLEHMKRIIATQDCDRVRTMRMMERISVRSEDKDECIGPLHDAASNGQMDTCKHLVEHLGFDVNSVATDGSGLTPLSCAVSHGKAVVARYFLDKGANLNKQDAIGFAPLHYAAKEGYSGMARLLISRGACVDIFSSEGTPLHVAASYGESGVLQILLEHHADPNMVSVDLRTPLAVILCVASAKVSESVCIKCMKLLVKAGADLNSSNPDTPLVIATKKGLTQCMTYLLEVGADPNISVMHDGSTPIEIAAKSGRKCLVELLFPFTSPIQSVPEWSVEGIIAYVKSGPSKATDKASVEDKKARLKLLGEEAVARMDYATASKFYTKAIELEPGDATLYWNRSFCHLKIGEAEDALRDANACIRLRPEWPKSYYRKGAALMLLKDYKEACDAFMDGLRLDPANVDLRNAYWEASEAMRKEHSAGSASSMN